MSERRCSVYPGAQIGEPFTVQNATVRIDNIEVNTSRFGTNRATGGRDYTPKCAVRAAARQATQTHAYREDGVVFNHKCTGLCGQCGNWVDTTISIADPTFKERTGRNPLHINEYGGERTQTEIRSIFNWRRRSGR